MMPEHRPPRTDAIPARARKAAPKTRGLFPRVIGTVLLLASAAAAVDLPDIATVPTDLTVPSVSQSAPAAGLRVPIRATGWTPDTIYHLLYLPTDWHASGTFPVIVEWTGNQYKNPNGDVCSGKPEDAKLGFGISGGKGSIWVTLPYLDHSGTQAVTTWWGDSPSHDPRATLAYCRAAVSEVCSRFGGDPQRVVLAGFSRGSIAANYLGLHDEETARLWRGFVCYSHYDGVLRWRFPGSDAESAVARLERLRGRPQFVCAENTNAEQTKMYLKQRDLLRMGSFTFCSTGFRNHDDAWVLRPSEARTRLREWFHAVVK